MTAVEGAWSESQVATFLGEALVPVRLACHHASDGLWMLSLWYQYDDGRLRCPTSRQSAVAGFLRRSDAVAFEVSTNRPPYMGVRGKGVASLAPDEDKRLLRDLLERYLGGTDSDLAALLLAEDREELVITVEPERLYTWDFTDRMQSVDDSPAARQPEPPSPRE